MKKHIKYIGISLMTVSLLSISSCTQDFEEINSSPNATTNPLTYGLFNNAVKSFLDNTREGFQSGRVTLPWVQYSAQRNYTEEDRYAYRRTSSQSLWSAYYASAQDYKKIIDLNTDPATAEQMSNYGPTENQIAASRIMLSYIFLQLVDTFGNVPYYSYGNSDSDFQALNIDTTVTPKFASQEKIYADILKELKESAEMVDTGSVVFTTGDQLFGSGEKLKKFANSLRLRVAVRVKGVIPGAEEHIQDAITSGVMESNDDSVGLTYQNDLINPAPFYSAYIGRQDFAINKTLVEFLKGNTGNFGEDPRLFKFAAPVTQSIASIRNGVVIEATSASEITGMPYGITSSQTASQRATASYFSANVIKKDFTEILMEYSEVEFLLSEVNGWDDTHYRKAVTSSLKKWGVSDGEIASFVSSLPIANEENVLTQKWVALFMQPYEAWAEYRRKGYPHVLLLPGDTGTLNNGGTYVFTSMIDGLTDLPTRLFYPTGAPLTNPQGYQEAIQNMGADAMDTKLIWDKN